MCSIECLDVYLLRFSSKNLIHLFFYTYSPILGIVDFDAKDNLGYGRLLPGELGSEAS